MRFTNKSATFAFTLLEVMVALSILAIALSAAIRASSNSANAINDLRQRTVSLWIAENMLASLRATRAWPELGTSEGEMQMMGETYYWRQTVTGTPAPIFRRVTVFTNIEKSEQRYLAKLVTLLPKQN